jgi:DNA-binding LytR/AlgR family response regulator
MILAFLITYNQKLKKNLLEAQILNKQFIQKARPHSQNHIVIPAESGREKVTLRLDDLYFIKSASNYVEIYTNDNDLIKARLIRTSLKKVEELFSEFSFLFKCHRTYIVNLEKVKSISGNSQGCLLLLENSGYTVPVSRSYIKELQEKINLIN